tara:strand:- start:913 stop:1395 length:483 start_codon:yes stop_codon:yes gene_type:complete
MSTRNVTEGAPTPSEYNHPGWSYKLRMQCAGVVSRYKNEDGHPQRTKCDRVEWLTIHPLGEVPMGVAIRECSAKLRQDLGWAMRKDITRLTPKGRHKRVWLCPTCIDRTDEKRTQRKVELKELRVRQKEELAAKEAELQEQLELLRAKQKAERNKASGKN